MTTDPLEPLREFEDALADIADDDVPDADLAHVVRAVVRDEDPDPVRLRRLYAAADESDTDHDEGTAR